MKAQGVDEAKVVEAGGTQLCNEPPGFIDGTAQQLCAVGQFPLLGGRVASSPGLAGLQVLVSRDDQLHEAIVEVEGEPATLLLLLGDDLLDEGTQLLPLAFHFAVQVRVVEGNARFRGQSAKEHQRFLGSQARIRCVHLEQAQTLPTRGKRGNSHARGL